MVVAFSFYAVSRLCGYLLAGRLIITLSGPTTLSTLKLLTSIFPEKAVEVVNGAAWTVELTLGQIELLASSYDTFALGHTEPKRFRFGDIHSIRFYDRELTADEVALNAEADAVKYNVGRLAPETTAPETTKAPSTNTPTTDKAEGKKGCGGFVAGSVAIIAIPGTALIAKKKD